MLCNDHILFKDLPYTMSVPNVELWNGAKMPCFGLGTWQSTDKYEITDVVKSAIDIGYRLFDCAYKYGNEKEIGIALNQKIADKIVKREDLFIVTKLWNTFHLKEDVLPACKRSLENFGLDYVDLYLIHWPCAQKSGNETSNNPFADAVSENHDFVETWKAMEELVHLDLVKNIGLSNFNSKQVQRILDNCTVKPAVNQIEVTPFLNQKSLIQFCRKNRIEIMSYSPLSSPARSWKKAGDPVLPLDDPRLVNIGKKYNKSAAQIVLRYVNQLGTIPIPKTSNIGRLKQNIDIFDFELTKDDLSIIDGFNSGIRICPAEELKDYPDYPFNLVE